MASKPPVDDPADDWGAPENAATSLDALPLVEGDMVTAPLPLGEAGFCEGLDLGFKRGVGAAMLELRDELIAGGTDAGTAALIAQKLGRACGVRGG